MITFRPYGCDCEINLYRRAHASITGKIAVLTSICRGPDLNRGHSKAVPCFKPSPSPCCLRVFRDTEAKGQPTGEFLFHRHPGDTQPWIDWIGYGWGIGHPDQHAATTLLEELFAADPVSDPTQLLQIVGAIDRGHYPDSSDHWNWETLYPEYHSDGFDWDFDVRDRLRAVVVDRGLARQLPTDWSFTDIVL